MEAVSLYDFHFFYHEFVSLQKECLIALTIRTLLTVYDRIVVFTAVLTIGDGFDLFDDQLAFSHVFMFAYSPVPAVFQITGNDACDCSYL